MIKLNLLNKIFNTKDKHTLPHFLIIGAQKAGTTSLWFHLRKHPDIEFSPNFEDQWTNGTTNKKEIHFFDKKYDLGIAWYKKQFNNNGKLQGEATPNYLVEPICHERMHHVVPNAKLIISLRDPVTRVYSAFNHFQQVENQFESNYSLDKSFEENFKLDRKTRFANGLIRYGFYANQIENLIKYYPKEQICIIISEQLKADPKTAYTKIFDFLEVNPIDFPITQNVHTRAYTSQLNEETRQELFKIYKPHNKKLFKLLGYEIEEWMTPYS